MEIQDQKRTGLFPKHMGITLSPRENVRLTIPAREALQAAGARVTPEPPRADGHQTYTVVMSTTMPAGLMAVQTVIESTPSGVESTLPGLRLENEPPYPIEYPDYWLQLDYTPCPICAAPLVWYEAGYVPGYRVCAKKPHHHMLAR